MRICRVENHWSKKRSPFNFCFFCVVVVDVVVVVVVVREDKWVANFLSFESHDRIRPRSVLDLTSGCCEKTSDSRPSDFVRAG